MITRILTTTLKNDSESDSDTDSNNGDSNTKGSYISVLRPNIRVAPEIWVHRILWFCVVL